MYLNLRNLLKNSTIIALRRNCATNLVSNSKIKMENPPLKVTLSERLSSLVKPVNYKLYLHPDLDTGKFSGNVTITVNVKQEKKYINLHSKFLNIDNVKVYKDDETEVPVSKFMEVKQVEQLLIHFENNLSPGVYLIKMNFDGDLTPHIVGFYLSRTVNNKTMVASKFQPTYARRAFPCFDEPEYKATYDITVVKPMGYIALSNMNEVSKTPVPGNKEAVTFATSVPMSTYLACFVVCDFTKKEVEVNAHGKGRNFILRAYAQIDQIHKVDFALDIARRATEFYISYYNVPYPLPKLDMIGIPDYQSGATEHWGLITYRETAFLYDQATSSARNRLNIAGTISHELAHMWFGNLVTLKWWDDIWLNEGFASYMQHKVLHAIEPSWAMYDQFVSKTLQQVLVSDSKLSSHPIVQTAESPDQITALFDIISYSKGASILRMMESFIGEENFRLGISDYLKKYQFSNAVTQDLLTELERYFNVSQPGLNLTYIVDTWTRQMGYPLLTVTKVAPQHYQVSQSRYLQDPDAKYNVDESPFKYRWYVPITYETNLNRNNNILWLSDKDPYVDIKLKKGETWFKLNVDSVGYYRVFYPPHIWQTLIDLLKKDINHLSPSDRANLLDDVFALADSRQVPYEMALELTTYLSKETAYAPWYTAHNIFKNLLEKLQSSIAGENLQKYIQSLIDPLYERLTILGAAAGINQRLLRSKILSLATSLGYSEAESRTRGLFLEWLDSYNSENAIEPDLRNFVYYYGTKNASASEWERVWQLYLKETDAAEQTKIRSALAASKDTTLLKKYLELAWDEKNVRSQDYFNVLTAVANNPSGTALVWDLVRSRWPELVARFSLNNRYLGNLIPAVTGCFSSELKLKEMEMFFREYPEAGAGAGARRRALETVRNNIKWVQLHEATVARWVSQHNHTQVTQHTLTPA